MLIVSAHLLAQVENSHYRGINPELVSSLSPTKAVSFIGKDSQLEFDILLLKNAVGFPIMYQSKLNTPVCNDTLCQIVDCSLFWDLTGKYQGFSSLTNKPLTKFDHVEFTEQDYSKLHQLMMDDNSVLQRKHKDELVDKKVKRESQKYDAVTSATALEIKNAVVEGALYTSYTLFHLANGEAKQNISKHTLQKLNPSLLRAMLESDIPSYHLFALKQIKSSELINYREEWVRILRIGIPLNRQYILKKLPPDVWKDKNIQLELARLISKLDANSRTLIIKGFKKLQKPSKKALEEISKQIEVLSRNQRISLKSMLK